MARLWAVVVLKSSASKAPSRSVSARVVSMLVRRLPLASQV
jgi:hypothetical protein